MDFIEVVDERHDPIPRRGGYDMAWWTERPASTPSVRQAANRTFGLYGVYGISVEGVIGMTVLDACRASEHLAQYRQIRLSTFGRIRSAGFALVATFDHPHFTLVLADLTDVTVARLGRCFDDPDPQPRAFGLAVMVLEGGPVMRQHDLAVDFMDMTNDRRLWTRADDARPGFTPVVGQYVVVGSEDADPAVARVVTIDDEGNIELVVLPGQRRVPPRPAHASLRGGRDFYRVFYRTDRNHCTRRRTSREQRWAKSQLRDTIRDRTGWAVTVIR